MQQHPIPQNVTQYQFRLVGDMTLKQFLELAFGLVLAYLFYASNLIFFIKWPFAILSLFLGFGLAFFPIEERPLDVWITNFLKSIYAPTRFIWQKTSRLPSFFLYQASPRENTTTAVKTVKAPARLAPQPISLDLSEPELARIKTLDTLFDKAPTTQPTIPKDVVVKPSVKVRKLSAAIIFDGTNASPAPHAKTQTVAASLSSAAPPTLSSPLPPPSSSPAPLPSPLPPPVAAVHKSALPPVAAQTINLPAPPKVPNLVVGMVLDKAGKMVEGAIVQIVNNSGVPVRAIRTNSLGQFYTATPLTSSKYTIEVEKPSLIFPRTSLETTGALIPPLLIKAS